MFDAEVAHYQHALKEAGYKDMLEYKEEMQTQGDRVSEEGRKKRRRSVIWYNPPYSSNVKTNIGRRFLTLLRKHFPPSSDLHKLFNTKKVKLSYSCCPSMNTIISSHNAKVTKTKQVVAAPGCNCRGGVGVCPLDGRCLVPSLVYKATVSSVDGVKSYIGQAASTFKLRYNNHMNSFTNPAKKRSTALSSYVWKLDGRGVDYTIGWSIECEPKPYTGGGRNCDLCLMEKTFIARNLARESLNRRTEIMGKCRHRLPFYLNNYHGLQLPPVTYQQELQQPDQDPPDPALPDAEQHDQQHPVDTLVPLLLPQPQFSGPMTRSKSRRQNKT